MKIASRNFIVITLLLMLTGCSSLNFYSQAITGQMNLLFNRRSLDTVLADASVNPEIKRKIRVARDVLVFAEEELGLPVGNSYSGFVDTGKRYVIWNVFAADEFSVKLSTFCYPIAGCVSYRGFFAEADAREFAAGLTKEGFDVFVGGVAAYSTLGWFDDPLLNTFLVRTDEKLAALLFHELAHKVVYIPGDTRFNESFATAVERIALSRWLESRGHPASFEQYLASEQRSRQVRQLIGDTRMRLGEIYRQEVGVDEKRALKQSEIKSLQTSYLKLRNTWGDAGENFTEFKFWMQGDINNARLGTVADYNDLVPAFQNLYRQQGEDLAAFFQTCEQLGNLPQEARQQQLDQLAN